MIELGERLTRVASFVPNGSKVCDVGSDHAYLPVYLIQIIRLLQRLRVK